MVRRLRVRSHAIACTLLLAFVGVLSATCIATAAEESPAQHACCDSMAADCGTSMAQEHSCCPTESVRFDQQTIAAERISVAAPDAVAVMLAAVMPVGIGLPVPAGRRAPSTPPPSRGGPATHLRLSILRV